MIPQIGLDDETFAEIMDKARKEIPDFYPEWTDYNAHDPGITLMELMAWLKEMQQFHLDQTGEAHIWNYLKLMGITPRGIRPAEACLSLGGFSERIFFPKGSRFFAGDVCFETTEERWMDASKVVKLALVKNKRDDTGNAEENLRQEIAVTEKKIRFPAFGMHPSPGDVLEIGLSEPLTPGMEQSLYLHFYTDAPILRNPVTDDSFIPLAEYTLSYLGADGQKRAVIRRDSTHQMLENGFLTFLTEEAMTQGKDGLYWLFLTLARSDYDLPPVIEEISLSRLKVRQVCTLIENHILTLAAEEYLILRTRLAYEGDAMLFVEHEDRFYPYRGPVCRKKGREGVMFCFPGIRKKVVADIVHCRLILYDNAYKMQLLPGKGTGMPFQEYPVSIPNLSSDGLSVMVEDVLSFSGKQTDEDITDPYFRFWEETADFAALGPEDTAFHFEEQTGVLFFGDCDHGAAPEGKIILASAQTSLGAEGNVKAGSICRMEDPLSHRFREPVTVRNDRAAAGGSDRENAKECKNRVLQEMAGRAVTYKDFETLVRQTPGLMIENVKVIPVTECGTWGGDIEEETVSIVVKPCSVEREPGLSEPFRQNLLHTLKSRRMIGTKLSILSPEYIGVTIFAEIGTTTGAAVAREQVEQTLSAYFKQIRAQFGICISYSDVYGSIDVLDCVGEIKSFGMDAQGKGIGRSRNGDILIPVNGLSYLKECHLTVSTIPMNI